MNMSLATPVKMGEKGSVSERVYQQIRHDIITGVHPQNTRINEVSLSHEMNVSRVPVREAMTRLEFDGLVKNTLHHSPLVMRWTAERVNNLFDVRLGIEVAAARYAARRVANGRATNDLLQALDKNDETITGEDPFTLAESSTLIHETVVNATENDMLIGLMRTISHSITWLFYLTSARDSKQTHHEHHELYDAILEGNEALAGTVAYAHIEHGRKPSLAALFPN